MLSLPQSPLMGQMMQKPLLISSFIEHADRYFGRNEIVSRRVEGDIHRYDYRRCHQRAKQFANALTALGVTMGQRVGTIAWNGYRHLEAYYAVSGVGAVLHTINPRLHPDQLCYIINHAEDQYVLFELNFLPLIQQLAARCPQVKGWIMLCDENRMPSDHTATNIPPLLCYESLLAAQSDQFIWPIFDENAASSLCYTSGTTGDPKGVLYSHRSTVLHTYASAMPDVLNVSSGDCILPVVPMFHVNAWGIPYSAAITGAKLVFPGAQLDGQSLYELFEQEQVTFSAGVPTVWLGLLTYMEQHGLRFSSLKRTVIGGAACSPAMLHTLRHQYQVEVVHAWGMTELSPLGTTGTLQAKHQHCSDEEKEAVLIKQGHGIYGIDMKIVDDHDQELPWDGHTFGNLMVKGWWVAQRYFKDEGKELLHDGWFATGDVATIDPDGYMQITDRSKDVIKSGGEWISTIDLENIAMSHPQIQQAACIGVAHPKWDERPLLIAIRKPGATIEKQALLDFYEGKIAKWWMPDDVIFIDSLPIGATGKILKNKLRQEFKHYQLPTH